jgi:8-oxo-dGTP diphosphatase
MSKKDWDFPVVAIRAIITDEAGRILLLRRGKSEYGAGEWCLPGGKVDYGQRVEDAVAREVFEETQLKVVEAKFLFYQDSLALKTGGMHCVNMYFECRVQGEIVLNPESSEYAYVAPADLKNYHIVFRNDEGIGSYIGITENKLTRPVKNPFQVP